MTYTKEMPNAAVEMPCGTVIDLERPRSEGVLARHEVAFLRENDLPLSYDPVQIGWLPATAVDDFVGLGREPATLDAVSHERIARKPQINALRPQYRLRAWEPSDVVTYRALLDDPQVWRHMPESYPNPLTPEIAEALIELSNASNHHQVYAVLRDAEIVGQVRLLYDVDEGDPGKAEISYWLGRAFWGKGIGSDIVALFTERCFADNPGVKTLIARVHRDNPGSARVLEKAGFAHDGPDPQDADWLLLSRVR